MHKISSGNALKTTMNATGVQRFWGNRCEKHKKNPRHYRGLFCAYAAVNYRA